MVAIELANDSRAPAAALGDSGTIAFGYGDESEPAFSGQVDSIKRRLAGGRRITLVNGAARLARRRLDKSFQGQSAGEIVSSLLGEVEPSISAGAIEDGVSYPFYAVDSGRTLLQHVADLARRNGHVAYLTPAGELFFAPPEEEEPAHEFTYAQDIITLQLEQRAPLINSALVTGEGAAGSAGSDAWPWLLKEPGPVQAEAGDGQPQELVADGSLRSGDAVNVAAGALMAAQISLAGRMLSSGAPAVRAGSTIRIAGAPDETFNGVYFVSRVRHRFDKARGYQTEVWFHPFSTGAGLPGGVF